MVTEKKLRLRQALISVSNKEGLVEFARSLSAGGVKIISTGGTSAKLKEAAIPAQDVAQLTGFPEILDGRVKTLHPKIFGGILARRDHPRHLQEIENHQIQLIDLVAVNLYPFKESPSIENIDIGGVTLLRAAAKNYRDVIVICDPQDYHFVLEQLQQQGELNEEERRRLAQKAFAHTADYDACIARFFLAQGELLPVSLQISLKKVQDLRYGENSHQKAALYQSQTEGIKGIVTARQLQGKELSFNNYLDLEAAYSLVQEFSGPACIIVKHNNPCGAAEGKSLLEAYQNALACDPVSAFGGVIGFNRPVDNLTAIELDKLFVECVIAPEYGPQALGVFSRKKNLRVLEKSLEKNNQVQLDYRCISGGFLVQEKDQILSQQESKAVTETSPAAETLEGLAFAWKVCKYVK
ncbi:MAG: bifunctional phosphoribosylaminoimidazolecarboxamide formyltransferase/IMP cyclohydrolase, partial [Elusimicrobiota bacterium]